MFIFFLFSPLLYAQEFHALHKFLSHHKYCRVFIQRKHDGEGNIPPNEVLSSQSKTPITQEQIKTLIDLVIDKYDFILIDCPAGIDEGFQTAIVSAHESVVIVTPEVPSIRDADKVIGILVSKGIKNNNLIINRIRPKMVKNDDMMSIEDVKNILGIPILGIVPDSEQVIIASNRGEPLVLEDNLSLPGAAFENIARRLLGEDIEILDMENISSKGLVKRIFGNILNRKNQNS